MSASTNIYAEIITIGDEILYGQITDTNSQWMGERLDSIGVRVVRQTTVGDNQEHILAAFREAEERAEMILITGGLGPTNDDLTKPCLSSYFSSPMVLDEKMLLEITDFFKSKGREMTKINERQAERPEIALPISNEKGTAPGLRIPGKKAVFYIMPGVPHEMKHLMDSFILPDIAKTFDLPVIVHRMVKTIGIGESWLSEKISDWETSLPNHIRLAYLPNFGQVRLRLTGTGNNRKILSHEIQQQIDALHEYAADYIFGYDHDLIEEHIGQKMQKQGMSLAAAESCSGGYFSHMITSVPGSSAFFKGSIIAYSNEIKMEGLGVQPRTLEEFGAVSEQTIMEMAEGIRNRFKSNIGIASSGIAGPGGGTPDKPVGTVWIAAADGHRTEARKLQLGKDRLLNIRLTAVNMMDLLRKYFL